MEMHTVWIVLGVVVALFILVLLIKSKACTCCGDCDCCGECCTVASLPMFVIGVVALWGAGLAAVGWLVFSLVRS